MSYITISVDKLSDEINDVLKNYNEYIVSGTKKAAKKSMNQLVKETKETAPVGHRHKHYRDSISSKKESENSFGVEYIWYVKGSDYRLSHLLENGHATRNGGRTKAYQFIKKSSDHILKEYEKSIEEVIKNG